MSVDIHMVRLSVPKGFPVPDLLIREGIGYQVLDRDFRTVGHVIERGWFDGGIFPGCVIELFDEYTLKVQEIADEA